MKPINLSRLALVISFIFAFNCRVNSSIIIPTKIGNEQLMFAPFQSTPVLNETNNNCLNETKSNYVVCIVNDASPTSLNFTASPSASKTIYVGADCVNWFYANSITWLTVTKSSYSLSVRPSINTTSSSRTGTMIIGGRFTITIYQDAGCTPPTIISTTPGSVCGSGSVTLGATASAGTIEWYSTSTGGSVLGTGASYTTPSLSSTTTYYVGANNNGCVSASRTAVVATVNPTPTNYMITGGGGYCSGGSGIPIGLAGSQIGVSYQLKLGAANVGGVISGTGNAIDFGYHTTGGTYTIVATNSFGCTSTSNQIVVTALPLPTSYVVTGGGGYCSGGVGVPIGLTGSQEDIRYNLKQGLNIIKSVIGTGSPISFGNQTAAGSYVVEAIDELAGCSRYMQGNVTVAINPIPAAPTANAQNFCSGATVSNLVSTPPLDCTTDWYSSSSGGSALTGTTALATGTYYGGSRNTTTGCISSTRTAVGITVYLPVAAPSANAQSLCSGAVVSNLTSTPPSGCTTDWYLTATGGTKLVGGTTLVTQTYYAQSRNTSTGCTSSARTSVSVTVNALPGMFEINEGGIYCSGGAGVPIGLSNSEVGVNYQLILAGNNVGLPVSGTGGAISFGNKTVAGTYTVIATNPTTGCVRTTGGSAVVSVNPAPTNYMITGGGGYCSGGSGVPVGLAGSQTGVNYQLKLGVANVGGAVSGTGNAIDFGYQTTGGSYTIVATNSFGCTSTSNQIVVTVLPLPTSYVVTGGGGYCSGGVGVPIGLSGSQADIRYNLKQGVTTITSVIGTGGSISFGNQTAGGSYTVEAVDELAGCTRYMSGSVTVTVNPLPAAPSASTQSFCSGATVSNLVSIPPVDCTTDWYSSSSGGSALTGTTALATGTYYGESRNTTTGCISSTRTVVSITVNSPVAAPSASAQSLCSGAVVSDLISTPPSGCATDWYLTATGGTKLVGGTTLVTQTYYAQSRNTSTGCTSSARTSVSVTVNALPGMFEINEGGTYCSGGAGVPIGLSNSQVGVNYQLILAGNNVGLPVSGTGGAISFGNKTTAGTYTVIATNPTTGCVRTTSGSAIVSVNPVPTNYMVTGGGGYCSGGSGVPVGLAGSQTGVNYQLKLGEANAGSSIAGTGNAIDFGYQTTGGSYTIVATNSFGCTSTSNQIVVTVLPLPTSYVVTGGGGYCSGGVGVPIGLIGSQEDIRYNLKQGLNIVKSVIGTGSPISFGNQTAVGSYVVEAIDELAGCTNYMQGSVTVAINQLPAAPSATSQSFCSGATVSNLVSTPPVDCTTDWYSSSSGGSPLLGETLLVIGTYYAESRNIITGCTSSTRTPVSINVFYISVPSANAQSLCSGSNVSNLISLPPTGSVTEWYTSSIGGSVLIGTTPITPGIYYAQSKDLATGCVSITRTPSDVTFINHVSVLIQPTTSINVLEGNSASFSITVVGEVLNYQWEQRKKGSTVWVNVGTNLSSYTIENVALTMNEYNYRCVVTGVCNSVESELAILNVSNIPNLENVLFSPALMDNTKNYIHEIAPQLEINSTALENILHNSNTVYHYGDINSTINYYDGFGRPIQAVSYRTSPTGKDVNQPIIYDEYGRELKKYLFYSDGYDGAFKESAINNQSNFYQNAILTGMPSESYPYSETVFEPSPLNRIVEHGAPGNSWQVLKDVNGNSTRLGNTVRYEYMTNAPSEVLFWIVNSSNQCQLNSQNSGYYPENTLYKRYIKDENGNISLEYKDIFGQIVLKKVGVGSANETQTYYVYNDLGLLCYVLPPMLIQNLGSSTILNQSDLIVKAYGYYYYYDGHKRLVEKQIPGAEPVYMVYDNRNRLVLTQDGNMRTENKWMFTKYDAMNRPVMTGVYNDNTNFTREQVQSTVETFYANTSNKYYEEEGSAILGYTDQSFPSTTVESLLTITYYDSYERLTTANGFSGMGFVTSGIIAYCDNDGTSNGYFDAVKGQITGTRVKVLDGNEHTTNPKWLATATYYDDRYRPIQTRGTLYDGETGGISTASTRYRFNGLVEQIAESQTLNSVTTERNTYMSYDHAGRLTKKEQQITGDATNSRIIIAEINYNELGQLQQKKLGGNVQSIDYKYNIRGWLTGINDPNNLGTDLFGMNLLYNDIDASIGGTAQFNGNISATIWNTQDKKKRAYSFGYDELNRLLSSDHRVYNTPTSAWTDSTSYEEKNISYDINGNITHLLRTNRLGSTANDFTYVYNGNQLSSINSGTTYVYDYNGNMTTDGLKGFSVAYNQLNLPSQVNKSSENVSYIYSAAGAKLAKFQNGTLKQLYAGSLVYDQAKQLDYILHDEGMVKANHGTGGVAYSYEYYLKDHLGNTRVVFNGSGDKIQVADYYPFGSRFIPFNPESSNKYLYNGKELQDDQIGGTTMDWYDYGARFYDPRIGRWHVIDPSCEDGGQESFTPYGYVFNDPIKHNDPDGRIPLLANAVGAIVGAAVEYGGQVAANVYENGWSASAFTDNIDIGDIGLAAGEGFLTCGGSVVKNALLKTAIVVGAEVTRNYLDVKTSSDGSGLNVSTNDVGTTIKNTAIGLTIGNIGEIVPVPKVKIMNSSTAKEAVKQARVEAKSAGTIVNRQKRIAIEKTAKQTQKTATTVNNTVARSAQNTVASGTSETTKRKTDEKK